MKLLFLQYFSWAKRLNLDSFPENTALVTLSFLLFLNVLSIWMLLQITFENFPKLEEVGEIGAIGIMLLCGLYVYFISMHHKKYLKIEKQAKKSNRRNMITVAYTILSFVFLYVSFLIKNSNLDL